MKKKGFTLVELLAVIAILAILVIVAMPNVLGMFNQAKANTFVTEVQKYMDTAKTSFMTEAMQNGGKEIIFAYVKPNDGSGAVAPAGSKKLDMDGSEKTYVIWFDRNGEFKRVIFYDENFCYDSFLEGEGNKNQADRIREETPKGFDKSKVIVDDVFERAYEGGHNGNGDSISNKEIPVAGDEPHEALQGCAGIKQAKTN